MDKQELEKHLHVGLYEHDFVDFQDVVDRIRANVTEDDIIIIQADYTYEDYSGSSDVYFYDKRDNLFYEVHGGHCSCYGLEDQWEPEVIGDLDFFKAYLVKQGQQRLLK